MEQAGPLLKKVPTEIWAKVFHHAQKRPFLEASYDEARLTECDVPISVSHVCDRFRQIVLHTPDLWTSIVVDFSSPTVLRATKLWLERSKNLPLSIFIYNLNGADLEESPEQRECFLLLLSRIGRWKEAMIEWSEVDRNVWDSMEFRDSPSLLESLVLRPSVDREDVTVSFKLPCQLWDIPSPHFQKLVVQLCIVVKNPEHNWRYDGFLSWATSNNIPYEQLTHLSLDVNVRQKMISCKEITSIFQRSPNLVCCFFAGISGPEWYNTQGPHRPRTPVLLTHLCHLYLEHGPTSVALSISLSDILRRITAPSLSSLTLVHERYWDIDAYKGFIERSSSCPLEELNLIDSDMDIYQLWRTIKAVTTSLRRFHVDNLTTPNASQSAKNAFANSFTAWNPTSNNFVLCPHLEQVSISPRHEDMEGIGMHNGKFGPPAFTFITQILESRLRPPAPDGWERTFKALVLPSKWVSHVATSGLGELCEEQFGGLRVEYNDDLIYHDRRRASMWKRLAYDSQ